MKRQITTILCVAVAGAALLGGGLSLTKASAETQTFAPDEFITPSSYEQYLPLTSPNSVAFTKVSEAEKFIAIADGNSIYIYDDSKKTYDAYEHSDDVMKVQFSGNTLYFIDDNSHLYTLNPYNLEMKPTKVVCSTFSVNGPMLYYSRLTDGYSKIWQTPLYDDSNEEIIKQASFIDGTVLRDNIFGPTTLTATNDSLYFIKSGDELVQYFPQLNREQEWTLPTEVSSIAVIGETAYFTSMKGGTKGEDFYVYNLHSQSTVAQYDKQSTEGYASVTLYEDNIYLVNNTSVYQYDPEEGDFTQFEIGASSTSTHRLYEGKDSVFYKGLLYTADKERISIYDTADKAYHTIDVPFDGDLISTNGNTVLLAKKGSYTANLYNLNGDLLYSLTGNVSDAVAGITCVNDTYYYVTTHNKHGKIHYDGSKWEKHEEERSQPIIPTMLTSDAQGYLYLSTTDGNVYKTTESDFLSSNAFSEPTFTGISATETKKILVDYHQNLYALQGNTLTKHLVNGSREEFQLGKTLVYGQTTATPVTTVAFSVESEKVYVLYDGNLMISMDIGLPCMSNITIAETEQNSIKVVFDNKPAVFEVFETQPNTLLIKFDLGKLKADSTKFPYEDYRLASESLTALKIGQTNDYALLAIFDDETYEYGTYLVKLSDNKLKTPEKEYLEDYAPGDYQDAWTSSSVNLYKFPYLTELLTVTQLPKNQSLKVIGTITIGDDQASNNAGQKFYHVLYGEDVEGYVPQSFINFFDGTPPPSTETTVGEGFADTDSGWRFMYILLGCAAVLVLVDYLILRPRKKDD